MIKVEQIKYRESLNNFSDVVTQLNWVYSLEGFQTISGVLELPKPTIENKFIPFKELDEDTMVKWVIDLINPESIQLQPVVIDTNEIKEIILNR